MPSMHAPTVFMSLNKSQVQRLPPVAAYSLEQRSETHTHTCMPVSPDHSEYTQSPRNDSSVYSQVLPQTWTGSTIHRTGFL